MQCHVFQNVGERVSDRRTVPGALSLGVSCARRESFLGGDLLNRTGAGPTKLACQLTVGLYIEGFQDLKTVLLY